MSKRVPGAIWAMGMASLFINTSAAAMFSLSALYLTEVLGVSTSLIGLLESTSSGVSYFTRTFSGVLSDFFRRRKMFILIGFILSTISRLILSLSTSYIHVFFARIIDRVGNGLQGAPREALVADHAPQNSKGLCMGLRNTLGLIGSTIGAVKGIVLMHLTNNRYKIVFLLLGIPAAIASLVVVFFIKERRVSNTSTAVTMSKLRTADIKALGIRFWMLMLVVVSFSLSYFSSTFICLHACKSFGLDASWSPLFVVTNSLSAALFSYPMGWISDYLDRKKVLLIGLVFFLFSYSFIGFATNLIMILFGSILWGGGDGITITTFNSLICDYVPKRLHGTSFSIYYLVLACFTVIANNIAGILSDKFGINVAFIYSAIMVLITITLLLYISNYLKRFQKSC